MSLTSTTTVRDDVVAAVNHARAVQGPWAARPARERAQLAARFARVVLDAEEEILDVLQAETGKNRLSAFDEVSEVVLGAAWLASHAPRLLRAQRVTGAIPVLTKAVQVRHPRGVVGLITPWNYPFTLPFSDALPALVAGNAVVLKPDALTPRIAHLGARLLREAGLPDGLLQIVEAPGRLVGPELVPRVDMLQFTGSTATGKILAELCGAHLVPFSGELGGKNAMLVLADADIPRAARGAVRGCFANSGQLCLSIERIYVVDAVADAFTDAFAAEVARMHVATGPGWDIDMGSLISTEHLAKVDEHVQDAIAHGARVLAGGHPLPELGPTFYAPTVLADVPHEAELYREETFGPVVRIERVADTAAAVRHANDTSYGLNASVWSRHHGEQVAELLHAGSVCVNEAFGSAFASPGGVAGGWGDSGIGGRHGPEGLLKYTRPQLIATQRLLELGSGGILDGAGYHRLVDFALRPLAALRSRGLA